MTRANHGGANFATKTGTNRKSEARYDRRAVDYAKTVETMKETGGFHRPGSRKKVGG